MPDFFFYTNPRLTKPQKRGDAYGPVDSATVLQGTGDFIFNLGGTHLPHYNSSVSNPTNPPAIAVCEGSICLIKSRYKDGGGTGGKPYYNLILKPRLDSFGTYPPIKYIIYRMIHHDSLFKQTITSEGSYELLEGLSTSPLLKSIWKSYDDLSAEAKVVTKRPSWNNLGMGKLDYLKSINGDDLSKIYLDDLFYYNFPTPTSSIPLPLVEAGALLGDFKLADTAYDATGPTSSTTPITFKGFSVDFLLDTAGFNPTIKELFEFDSIQQVVNRIKILGTETDNVLLSAKKNSCLNYIDPTAFYGEILTGEGNNRVLISGASDVCSTAEDLYKFLMVGRDIDQNLKPDGEDSNLYNRNRVYIDIRDRYRYPYSFFRDKDGTDSSEGVKIPKNNLALSIDNKPLVPIDYNFYVTKRKESETDNTIVDAPEFQWPILILDYNTGVTINYNNNSSNDPDKKQALGFPEAEEAPVVMNTEINLAFPSFEQMRQDNFVYFDNQAVNEDSFFRNGVDSDRFKRETPVSSSPFCEPYKLLVKTYQNKPVAGYKRVRHIEFTKEVLGAEWNISNTPEGNETYPVPLYLQKNNYLDFVFPVEMKDKWKNYVDVGGARTHITSSVWHDQGYFDNTLISGRDFMGYMGIAHDKTGNTGVPNDKGKVTLFAFDSIPVRAAESRDGVVINPDVVLENDANFKSLTKSNVNMEFSIIEKAVNRNRFYNEVVAGDGRIRTVRFSLDSIKPTNPNNPDSLSSSWITLDILENSSSTNRNDEANQRNDICFRSTEDFIAMGIPKDSYEDIMTTIYPQQFLNHSAYVKGTPVFFGFKPVDSGVANEYLEWVKFEITLDGYRMVNNQTTLYRHSTGIFIYENIDTLNINNYEVPDITPDTRAFDINTVPPLNPSDPPSQSIVCKIYLAKSPDISYGEFIKYSEYFRSNIRHVYNTDSNKGLTASVMIGNTETSIGTLPMGANATNINATYPVNTATKSYQQVNPINADGVEVFHASPIQFKTLGDNEIIIMVQRNQPAKRSAMVSYDESRLRRRQGTMYFKADAPADSVPYWEENTAAHEFGHILSLADRYTAVLKLKTGDPTDLDEQEFGSVIYYLDSDYDPDYTSDFRWMHNLMGLDINVPKLDPESFHPDYWERISEFASPTNDINQFGTIFITPKQWQYIYDEACAEEQPPPETLDPEFEKRDANYFIPASAAQFKTFAFAGFDPDNSTFISDNGFDESSTNRLTNHTMSGRKMPTALSGYYDAYIGNETEDFLRSIEQTKDALFYLTIGRSLSNLIADHREAINKATAPAFSITVNLTDQVIQTTHLDYSAPASGYGLGDTAGDAVWNHLGPKTFKWKGGEPGKYSIGVENDRKINVTVNFTWNIEYTNRLRILKNG